MRELSRRESLLSFISDAHKDAYGFRPRGMGYNEMSLSELEAEADRLSDAVAEAVEEEARWEAEAQARWEASINLAIESGAPNRLSAIRWLLDAEDLLEYANLEEGYLDDFVNFKFGVGYRYNLLSGENKY